jgi:hypothetical protein
MNQRQPRIHDEAYLRFIRTLPCVICGDDTTVEAAHVAYSDPSVGKRSTGMAEKSHDKYALPVCGEHHRAQHQWGNERDWWKLADKDPVKLALAIFSARDDYQEACRIIEAQRIN